MKVKGKWGAQCSVEGCQKKVGYRCDYKAEDSEIIEVCDQMMCSKHAKLVRFNVHYCPEHAEGETR